MGEDGGAFDAFVLRAKRFLEDEGMGERNAYHPTGDARADGIRAKVAELIAYVKRETEASGPAAKRCAALAVTNFEQGAMWAVKALLSEDAVRGDNGGSERRTINDPNDLLPPRFDEGL
jgi:hypothetical protein